MIQLPRAVTRRHSAEGYIELEPEDGCLTVFGPGEQWFYAPTEDGVENLKELIQIHRTAR